MDEISGTHHDDSLNEEKIMKLATAFNFYDYFLATRIKQIHRYK